jgi:hypothetical protein
MYELSNPRREALEKSQAYFQRANLHPSTLQWRQEAIENFGFYDGSGQWRNEDLLVVRERGQIPLTVNIIQGRLDSLSGVEIQSRFRTAVQNDSGNIQNDNLAKAITHWLYFVQQDQNVPHKGSLKFRDMLTCGIGWSNLFQENGKFFYDYIHPFNIIPDPDDLSPQFTSMKFLCRKRWMELDVVRKLWPKVAQYIDFSDPTVCDTIYSPEIMDRNTTYTNINNYSGYAQSRVLVCEVQYKVSKKAYGGIDVNGFYFETFSEEKAEELANSSKDIEEKESQQILRTLFLDNYLLEHAPLDPNIPNMNDFSYIPCVWKRRFKTGVPYGLLDSMKDIQRDSNVRLTKALYLINSSRLIVKGSLPPGETVDQISEQLKRPDAVIMLPAECEFDLKDNAPLSEAQLKMYAEYDKLMQRVTGIYDDMMGRETNASSGVAQRQRQINSVRNNVFAFDNFADMKEREAKFMVSLLQGGQNENMLSQILTEEEKETIILNLTRTVKGKKFVFNDVRTLPLSLEIEEVPDYKSSMEENRAALENLLSNPNAMFIMQSPSLMKRLGIRDYQKLADEIKETMSARQGEGEETGGMASQSSPENPQAQNLAYPGL